jgi:tetratricopeptide (TPR) repeat protein
LIRRPYLKLLVLCSAFLLLFQASAQEAADASTETLVRGNAYLSLGDCELAQFHFQEALRLEPENAEALTGNGQALACRFNYPRAVDSLKKAIEVSPDHTPAYVQLALVYQSQYFADPERYPDRLTEALGVLETAERRAPDDTQVLNTKGVILFQMGELGPARAALEHAAESAAKADSGISARMQSVIQVNLGKTYRDLSDLQAALGAFRRAVVLDPNSASAHSNLGNTQFRLGECEAAEYELSQAAALDPSSLSAVADLAITLFECGNVSASIPRFEQALELPGSIFLPPLYGYVSRAYIEEGRYDDAVKRAVIGSLLPPPSADAQFYLGEAYRLRGAPGDSALARIAYEKALELEPGYEAAQRALELLR